MSTDAWMTTEQAATYGGWHSAKSFWEFARRHQIPSGKAGRRLRWKREDIDKALARPDWAAYWRRRA